MTKKKESVEWSGWLPRGSRSQLASVASRVRRIREQLGRLPRTRVGDRRKLSDVVRQADTLIQLAEYGQRAEVEAAIQIVDLVEDLVDNWITDVDSALQATAARRQR